MQDLIVTFIQSDLFWNNQPANLQAFETKILSLEKSTNVIILPEMFNTGFVVEPETVNEQAAEESLSWMRKMAEIKNAVVCGSMIVKEDQNYYNRFFWVLPDGSYDNYDKRHLFSLGGEHHHFTSGRQSKIIEYKGWKIKPLICYDLRFPVWAKNTYQNGAYEYDLLIYVANWPVARVHAWKSLLVGRAIENQSYAIGVNRIGKDGRGTSHSGCSGIVEPKGEWISEEVENIESFQTIKLNKVDLDEYRQKFNFALDWDQFNIQN